MNPLVSIITPNYNSAQFIAATIKSVLQQTYTHWELLIIDDGSTDTSIAIIEGFCEQDSRIHLVKLHKNQGPAKSRNKGIELAKGSFIAFLDSDDRWFSNKLEVQLAFMRLNNVALSFSSYVSVDEAYQNEKQIRARDAINYKDLLLNNFIGCLTAMYSVDLLGKVYFPDIKKRQDWALWLKITKRGITARGIQQPLAYYTRRNESVSSNKVALLKYNWKVYRDIEHIPFFKSCWLLFLLVLFKFFKN